MTSETSAGTTAATPERSTSFSLDIERRTIADAFRDYSFRLRTGEPGALPSVLGLVVLGVIFSQVSTRFLTKYNIGNVPGQGAYIAIIAMGLIFVLLLGEIDLSAGTTGGMCAGFAVEAIFSGNLHHDISAGIYWSLVAGLVASIGLGVWLKAYSASAFVLVGLVLILTNVIKHEIPALIAAVAIGVAVGIFNGWLVAKVGIPSFIATLALFLAWQGMLLFAVKSQAKGTTNYSFWFGLTTYTMSPAWSWVFVIVVVAGYLGFTILKSVSAQRRGLAADTMQLVLARGAVVAAIGIVITALANENRNPNPAFQKTEGLPWAAVIPIGLLIICTLALTKTEWGRHLYATGGNQEAARRAGIDVVHIKVTAFALCSGFAALGGIFLASNSHSVSLDLGAGNTLLFAVAAAVIGGTSLFGGRGKPRDALIGALVIVIIPNGLTLKPNLPPQIQQIITGGVLLVAAAVDAVTRRRSRIR